MKSPPPEFDPYIATRISANKFGVCMATIRSWKRAMGVRRRKAVKSSLPPHDPERAWTVGDAKPSPVTNGTRAKAACAGDPVTIITFVLHRAHADGKDPLQLIRDAERLFRLQTEICSR